MLKKWRIFFQQNLLLLMILLLGFLLRCYRYPNFPISGETADETAWTMLGASLIQTHQPKSWSHFAAYQDHIEKQLVVKHEGQDVVYNLVSPVVDHPPLFSFIPGFFHSLKASWDQIPSIKLVRFPMIVLGSINLFLLFLVAQKIFKHKSPAYLSTLLYAVLPSFVFSSRLVVAENLLITWVLLTIYLLKTKFKHRGMCLVLISIVAILTKVAGVVIPATIVAYGWQQKNQGITRKGLLGLLMGAGIFLFYGALLDWQLFFKVNLAQSGRNLGLSTLSNRLLLNPALVEKIFFDGWIILGLMAIIAWFLIKPKQAVIIKINFIFWLVFIALTSGETTFHGWYDYPLYPLLALALGWLLNYVYQLKNYWLNWLLWLMLLPGLRMALILVDQATLSNLSTRGIIMLGAIPLGFSLTKKSKLAQYASIILFSIIVICGGIIVFKINPVDYWETHQFFSLG